MRENPGRPLDPPPGSREHALQALENRMAMLVPMTFDPDPKESRYAKVWLHNLWRLYEAGLTQWR